MVDTLLIDVKSLLVEREECDAGTVTKLREALAQGGKQYRSLRDVTDQLKKKVETSAGAQAKRWHLKLGIALLVVSFVIAAARVVAPAVMGEMVSGAAHGGNAGAAVRACSRAECPGAADGRRMGDLNPRGCYPNTISNRAH